MRLLPLFALIFSISAIADPRDCAPISGPISFSGSWVFTDSANFVAGDLPDFGSTLGRLEIEPGWGPGEWSGESQSGRLSFRAYGFFREPSRRPYFAYPQGSGRPYGPVGPAGTVNIVGNARLSAQGLQQIQDAIRSGLLRIPGVERDRPDLRQVCVSGMAMNVGRVNAPHGGWIQGGMVHLYLNHTRARFGMRF